jgi:formylglycine-generating enzyme required for sulfatase activity
MKLYFYMRDRMRRRQRPIYSRLQNLPAAMPLLEGSSRLSLPEPPAGVRFAKRDGDRRRIAVAAPGELTPVSSPGPGPEAAWPGGRVVALSEEAPVRQTASGAAVPAEPGQSLTPRSPNFWLREGHTMEVNSLGMAFVLIPAGVFVMGSPEHESGRYDDEIQHEVTITQSFYLQVTPVTQGQWRAVMGTNPSSFRNGAEDCPVEQVSWHETQQFIRKLNGRKEGSYRLPTEAEWEYAARAGSTTAFANGEISSLFCEHDANLDEAGWYCGNSGWDTHPVGLKTPNDWNLYDMHGNVYEWCQDWYGAYPASPLSDPAGPPSGFRRVMRGGSWFSSAKACRLATRLHMSPNSKTAFIGFRVVASPRQTRQTVKH